MKKYRITKTRQGLYYIQHRAFLIFWTYASYFSSDSLEEAEERVNTYLAKDEVMGYYG